MEDCDAKAFDRAVSQIIPEIESNFEAEGPTIENQFQRDQLNLERAYELRREALAKNYTAAMNFLKGHKSAGE